MHADNETRFPGRADSLGAPEERVRKRDVGKDATLAYDHLFEAIVDQRLLPGTKLTEQVIADVLGVSRRSLGVALQRLAWERLIVMVPNHGAYIASPSIDEVGDVFGARLAIESGTTEAVALYATPEQLAELSENLELEQDMRRKGRVREAIHHSGGFHTLMARMSGNVLLAEQVKILVARTSLIVDLFENQTGMNCWHEHHDDLIDLCRARKAPEAVSLMREHIRELRDGLALDRRRATPLNLKDAFVKPAQR